VLGQCCGPLSRIRLGYRRRMIRRDLPLEHAGPLDFRGLLEVLDTVVGERVYIPVYRPEDLDSGISALEIGGTLRRLDAPAGQHLFAIGDAAWLSLDEGDFRAATLRTDDGNDYFSIAIELRRGSVLVGDQDMYGSQTTDPDSAWNQRDDL